MHVFHYAWLVINSIKIQCFFFVVVLKFVIKLSMTWFEKNYVSGSIDQPKSSCWEVVNLERVILRINVERRIMETETML